MSDTNIIELANLSDVFELPLSRNVYYVWVPGNNHPTIAHACRDERPGREGQWRWSYAGTRLHTVVAREPLHLEPSIGWMECCGRHGWIRGGLWESCPPDEGYRP